MTEEQFRSDLVEMALEDGEDMPAMGVDRYGNRVAWGKHTVYYVEEYDGYYSVRSVPRNPPEIKS